MALATDTTNSMVGKTHSLKTEAKKRYKDLVHVHCPNHVIDLCAKDGMKAVPEHIEWMIRQSYNFFAHSTIRQNEYRKILELVGFDSVSDLLRDENDRGDFNPIEDSEKKKTLKLISPSTTRWLVIADCMQRVLQQYDALKAHFDMVRHKSPDYEANTLYKMYHDEANRVRLLFLYPILMDLRRLTKLFQTKTADNIKILKEIKDYFLILARRILQKRTVDHNSIEQLCQLNLETGQSHYDTGSICLLKLEEMDFGELFSSGIQKFSQNTQKLMKQEAHGFLKALFIGLQKRMLET